MLIFLDIDGVMVPAKSWKAPELLDDGFPAFSSKATLALQQLLAEGDTVMLTTSHKARFSIEEWKAIFEKRNFQIKSLKVLPENVNHLSRKEEIVNWFEANRVEEDFVIIDDDSSLNDLPIFLKGNLSLTNSSVGLTQDHLKIVGSIIF